MTEPHEPRSDLEEGQLDDASKAEKTISEEVTISTTSGAGSKLDYFLTCSLGALAGASGAMIYHPDILVGSLVTATGALLCALPVAMGTGVLGLNEIRKDKKLDGLDLFVWVFFLGALLFIAMSLPKMIEQRSVKEATSQITASMRAADIQLSRDKPIVQKKIPAFILDAYEEKFHDAEEALFLMLDEPSSFETVTGKSLGIVCAKGGQWRMPVSAVFDVDSQDVELQRLSNTEADDGDMEMLCYNAAQ